MTRRSFLSTFLKGAVAAGIAPQIVTHGLHLRRASGLAKVRIVAIGWYDQYIKYGGFIFTPVEPILRFRIDSDGSRLIVDENIHTTIIRSAPNPDYQPI